jgi:peptide/nickel transport system ATP-binding protein
MSFIEKYSHQDQDIGGPGQALLIVDQLTKYFPIKGSLLSSKKEFVHAVNGVSFQVRKGETLGIVGESGCGKSTLAKLLSNLISPNEGSMIFDGQGINEQRGISLKNLRKNLQMVFQDSYSSLNPRLNILSSIAYGPIVHGMPKEEANQFAAYLMNRVGLEHTQFGSRYPHELSGGQRQRGNIARALSFSPRLLILDEAVAALDKSVQAQVLNLLSELKEEEKLTYLFISHDLNVVNYMSDRVLVMYLGKIVEIGAVDRIFHQTAHPYTKALLSAQPSVNPMKRQVNAPITGDPPSPINLPKGCSFKTRCPFANEHCEEEPELKMIDHASDHWVSCHHYLKANK